MFSKDSLVQKTIRNVIHFLLAGVCALVILIFLRFVSGFTSFVIFLITLIALSVLSKLCRRFLHALNQLGGSHAATPKQNRELMKVDGLTNEEVRSHLQEAGNEGTVATTSETRTEAPSSERKTKSEKSSPVVKGGSGVSSLPPKALEVAPDNEFDKRLDPKFTGQ